MNSPDHTLWSDLLTLEVDGRLTAEQRARVDHHVAGCAECRTERAELLALTSLLQRGRLPVQTDFRERVMKALPAAGWESRHPRTWTFPVAVFGALTAVGVALLGAGSARLGHWGSLYGVLAALAGMLRAAVFAGIGFTTASWRWFGMFVEQLLASSMSLAMFGVFVVCLNLLLISLVRRRRTARASQAQDPGRRFGRRDPRNL